MRLRHSALFLLLICLNICPILAIDMGQWHGDVTSFVLKDGILSISEDAKGSDALLYRGYDISARQMTYVTEALFDKPPTSRNTFQWEVISHRSGDGEYGLYVTPTSQGKGLALYQELPSGTDRKVSELLLKAPHSDWQRLKISVDKDDKRYRLRAELPSGKHIVGDWITPPLDGEEIGRMIFAVKFTKTARNTLHWRLPTVEAYQGDSIDEDEDLVDISILSITPDSSGKVTVHLDRAVDASQARAYCEGYRPSLRTLSTDATTLEVDLHQPFVHDRSYTFTITGLRTLEGERVGQLSFEISTEEDDAPSDFGSWTGDLSQFVLSDGLLSLHPKALGPSATLVYDYGGSDRTRLYAMTSRMQRAPTSRNTFSWQVLAYDNGVTRYCIVVKPSSDGREVYLYTEALKGETVSRRTLLTSLPVTSPPDSWADLQIYVHRESEGFRLRTVDPSGGEQSSPLVRPDLKGQFVGQMTLTAKFSKGEKDKLHWTLPQILVEGEDIAPPSDPSPEDPSPPPPTTDEIRVTSLAVIGSREVSMHFSQGVDASLASVTCRGFSPSLTVSDYEPTRGTIDMGKELEEGRTYKVTIRGLKTLSGQEVKTLSFEVTRPIDDTPSDEIKGWTGQLAHFYYKDSILSIAKGSTGPRSEIVYHYGEGSSAWRWDLRCHLDRLPSLQNTFQWELCAYTDGSKRYMYYVRPDAMGGAVQLCREEIEAGRSHRAVVLSSLEVNDPSTSWQDLSISVVSTRLGWQLSIIDEGRTIVGEVVGGKAQADFVGSMTFIAKYTKNEKSKLHWRLPTVIPIEDIPEEATEDIDGWSGDLTHFVLKQGVLSLSDSSPGPSSTVTKSYDGVSTAWRLELKSLMVRKPTPQNTFRWTLFSYGFVDTQRTHTYFIRPDHSGAAIQLCREVIGTTSSPKTEVLTSISVADPLTSWADLMVQVSHSRKGVMLTLVDRGQVLQSDTLSIPTERGSCQRTMALTARYTRSEKARLHWTLPTATAIEDDPEEPSEPTPDPLPAIASLYISELMVSPPDDGVLEGCRYIELFNPHDHSIDLGRILLRYKGASYPLPQASLPSHTYITLYEEENPPAEPIAQAFGMARFPALSGQFVLQVVETSSGRVLDRVKFTHRLYGRGFERGRASVERLTFALGESQWRRSSDPRGGTPSSPTTMRPAAPVAVGAVVINELLLSPPSAGERYIELHNTTDRPIPLQDLYLRYRNHKPEGEYTEWRLVTSDEVIPPRGYIVLTPYPETLLRLYDDVPRDALIERVDLPTLSPTYTELALCDYATDEVIDQALYRKQYLGHSTKERTGVSLERRQPGLDGLLATSWHAALKSTSGGTPGRANSVLRLSTLSDTEDIDEDLSWPEDPDLDYPAMLRYSAAYADRLSMDVYTLAGQHIIRVSGQDVLRWIDDFRQGRLSWETRLYLIVLKIKGDADLHDLYYKAKWLYHAL